MNSLVPKLRFKEFKGSWEIKPLIQLSVNGFSNGAFNDPKKVGSGYRIINVKDMYINGTINIDTLTRVALDEHEFSKNRVEYGDIFFTRSSIVKEGIAYSNVNLNNVDDLTYDGHLIRMRPDKSNHSPIFLYYNFSTSTARKEFVKRGKTATMTTIGQEDISKVNIVFPSLPEQQKIASFLSAVDEKIQQLIRKKELLEQYKKGIMQQLFSGKLRFKDENGKAFPKWEEKKLIEIAFVYDGTHQTPTYVDRGIPFYSVEHVTANNFSDTKFISEEAYEKDNKRVKLEIGDILMTRIGDIGTAKLIDWDVRASFYVSLALLKIQPDNSSKFLSQYIHSRNFQLELWKRTIHVAFPKKINLGEIGQCHILLPSLREQRKIASFLSALAQKIEHVTNQITQAQTFKKGLLKQMFV